MRRLLLLSISTSAALLLAATAFAGSLPSPPGAWDYSGSTKKVPLFKIYVLVDPAGQSYIYNLNGVVDGTCKYKGKKVFGSADFNVDTRSGLKIPVKPNGTFKSKTLKTIGDAAGEKGRARIKGTIKGTRVTGTVTARTTGNALGPCKGKGKFKGKGELIPGG